MSRFGLFGAVLVAGTLVTGCQTTQQVREVTQSGFLGDYSLLQPGAEGEAALVYVNPNANLGAYKKVLIDPVTVWLAPDSNLAEMPVEERQRLADSLYAKLLEALGTDYQTVSAPGPGVMRISAAITEAEKRRVVLDTISTVYPAARAMSQVKSMATGTQSFVGGSSAELKVTDAQTGELLFAAADRRAGGKTLEKGFDSWSDVENAFQYWAGRVRYRLCQERGGANCVAPQV
jgi:Protein of unknown function (DUF3313)